MPLPRAADDISEGTLRLLLAHGVGPVTAARLVAHFGDHDRAAAAPVSHLAGVDGVSRAAALALRTALDQADPESERRAMGRCGVGLILLGDGDYPPLLAAIDDPPAALWVRGRLETADRLSIAIVGSRTCTAYGRTQAGRFASLLAGCGLTVVSGGALGIDGEAHRGALRAGGRTIAVMGCGLGRWYPPQHAELFERIASGSGSCSGGGGGGGGGGAGGGGGGGALLSDLPMGTEPRPGNFPRRNRIIAGLSLGVLVIEAARHSGALITARFAGRQGREVSAVPGRVDAPTSAGCHAAIREGWAALVTSHLDLLEQLEGASHLVRGALLAAGGGGAESGMSSISPFAGDVTEAQAKVLAALGADGAPLGVDELSARTGLPVGRVVADLTLLQIRGRVRRVGEGFTNRR